MKRFSLVLLAGAMMGLGTVGCAHRIPHQNDIGATPGLSSRERIQRIDANMAYEGQQAVDDLDTWLLTRPSSRLTIWNTR